MRSRQAGLPDGAAGVAALAAASALSEGTAQASGPGAGTRSDKPGARATRSPSERASSAPLTGARRLALKVDVDTLRGTLEGVPRLLDVLAARGLRATFLFSLGPDRTGVALRRIFRPGFLAKVGRTSVTSHYGLRTLLYGTLLPAPDIGRQAVAPMRAARDAGHEVGVHCWDHVEWQDRVAGRPAAWTGDQMRLACERFAEVFGEPARVHGAAGWQMSNAAYRLEGELGFTHASDGRGREPFVPVLDGVEVPVPQMPGTLPTLDELIGTDGLDEDNVHARLAQLTGAALGRDQVFTLHAELEGGRLRDAFERMLDAWLAQGWSIGALDAMAAGLDVARLPRCRVTTGTVPGRSGTLAVQGGPVAARPVR